MAVLSWQAEGLVELAWKRLGVKNGRDALAQLTGIPATNLSSINRGKRRLSLDAARKISDATGATLLELGAPIASLAPDDRNVYDRLEALVEQADEGRQAVIAALRAIELRLSRIERQLGLEAQEG